MANITQLAQRIIDTPLVERPDESILHTRNRRRRSRRIRRSSVVTVLVVAALAASQTIGASNGPAPAADVHLAAYFQASVSVSDSTLTAVGLPASVAVPNAVTPTISTAPSNGTVIFVGAEYCPYCALQRWALLVALSRFGTFTHLSDRVFSSSSDVYPNLASFSFVGASYSSRYFSFDPTELTSSTRDASGGYQRLQSLSHVAAAAYRTFDPGASLPFVDFGNQAVAVGASSSPSVLEGLSLGQVGASMSDPASGVARAVDGAANYFIGAMCSMISKSAPNICSSLTSKLAVSDIDSGVSPSNNSTSSQAPSRPAFNAPMTRWRAWSVAMHAYLTATAAHYQATPGCVLISINVSGTKLKKSVLGIPAGITNWAISVEGRCAH